MPGCFRYGKDTNLKAIHNLDYYKDQNLDYGKDTNLKAIHNKVLSVNLRKVLFPIWQRY